MKRKNIERREHEGRKWKEIKRGKEGKNMR